MLLSQGGVRSPRMMTCFDAEGYVCSRGGIAMSAGDGTSSNTQVSGARCVWMLVAMSYLVKL
jgi:hypothetical protein